MEGSPPTSVVAQFAPHYRLSLARQETTLREYSWHVHGGSGATILHGVWAFVKAESGTA